MKKLLTIRNIVRVLAILALGSVCQTTVASGGSANPNKEMLLAQTGFKIKTLTTHKQQQQVDTLPHGTVSAVTYQGKLYYVYPTAKRNQIYVGKQQQFNAYKQALQAQKAAAPSPQFQQDMAGHPDMTGETAGPDHVRIREFDGFGPMAMDDY
jgi:hypothetical protein